MFGLFYISDPKVRDFYEKRAKKNDVDKSDATNSQIKKKDKER